MEQYEDQMRLATSLEVTKLMESEEFAEMAKEKGLSNAGFCQQHTSLFKRTLRSSLPLNQVMASDTGHNISLPILETPSKMSTRSNQRVAYSEMSATPEKGFSPM